MIIILFYLYTSIFFPSYLSVLASCNEEKFIEKYSKDYSISGTVTIMSGSENKSATEEDIKDLLLEDFDIDIIIKNGDKKTYKHEIVHVNQLKRGRISFLVCENSIGKYISEVEAYTASNLPDFIFTKLYDTKI